MLSFVYYLFCYHIRIKTSFELMFNVSHTQNIYTYKYKYTIYMKIDWKTSKSSSYATPKRILILGMQRVYFILRTFELHMTLSFPSEFTN